VQPYGALLGLGIAVVAIALGYVTARQVPDRRLSKLAGWGVGLCCFAVLNASAYPVRQKWIKDDCLAQYAGDREAMTACIGAARVSEERDDRSVGP
jgi:multisubunit Na+/H+ antiporter MnhB subunit